MTSIKFGDIFLSRLLLTISLAQHMYMYPCVLMGHPHPPSAVWLSFEDGPILPAFLSHHRRALNAQTSSAVSAE